jgi:hypothetical protein
MFKVGDKVEVNNTMARYSRYKKWAHHYGFYEEFCRNHNDYYDLVKLNVGDIGTIFAIGKHLSQPEITIYGVYFEKFDLKTIMDPTGIKPIWN